MSNTKEIFLQDIWSTIIRARLLIILITLIAAIFASFYALSLPNIYKSDVLVSIKNVNKREQANSNISLLQNFAGIGGLPTGGNTNKVLAKLTSDHYLMNFIQENDLSSLVYAANGWDSKSNKILFDETIYNSSTNKWVEEYFYDSAGTPDIREVVEILKIKYLDVLIDPTTNLISISFKHYSPYVAKEFLDSYILYFDDVFRKEAIQSSSQAIDYLLSEQGSNVQLPLQKPISNLIELELANKILAYVEPYYLLDIVVPSISPMKKHSPSRKSIVISISAGIFFITLISIILLKQIGVNIESQLLPPRIKFKKG